MDRPCPGKVTQYEVLMPVRWKRGQFALIRMAVSLHHCRRNDMTSPAYRPNMTITEEGALIRKILRGRKDLFGELLAPHLTTLLRIVGATIGGHPEVEDIVQQTALKAFTHLRQFRFEARFSTWLIRIGLNEVRTWRRKCASSRLLALDLPTLTQLPVADQRHSPLIECQRNEASLRLRVVLDWLPGKYRIVML